MEGALDRKATKNTSVTNGQKGPSRKRKNNNSSIPPLLCNSAGGNPAIDAFSRALAATDDRDVSPIAKSLFIRTLHRDVAAVRRCKEEANASDGLLMDDISEGEPPEGFVQEAVVEALDEIICNESFLNLQDSDVESEISGVDRESWEVDVVEDEKNLAPAALHNNEYLLELHCSGGLHLHQCAKVKAIIESNVDVERKLLHLFMKKSFFAAVLKWTNKKLSLSRQSRGRRLDKFSQDELFA